MDYSKLVYPQESYKVTGILYATHNDLGRSCNEKQYCDRIESQLKALGISYEREKELSISFDGETPGRNKIDFIIMEKIILEVKAKRLLTREALFNSL